MPHHFLPWGIEALESGNLFDTRIFFYQLGYAAQGLTGSLAAVAFSGIASLILHVSQSSSAKNMRKEGEGKGRSGESRV